MDDLISRQAAIEALARVARKMFTLSDEFNHYLAGLMDGENAIRQLPSVQPEQRWIPIKNRLPAVRYCRCLITRDDGRGRATVEEALFSFGRWYSNEWLEDGCNRKFDISTSVIAWAPFPEPYRGGDSE